MNENLSESNNITSPVEQNVEFQNNFEVLPTENIEKNQTTIVEPPKKKKKGKVFIIILLIIGIIVGIVFGVKHFINKSNYFEDPFPDIDTLGKNDETNDSETKYNPELSFVSNIEADYKNGVITTDYYMLQLAYSIYEPNKLDDKYKSLTKDYANPRDLYTKLDNNYHELSYDTLRYIIGKYMLDYVKWDVGEESETEKTSNSTYDYKIKKLGDVDAYANKLDHVILSNKGNFLIYYTTDGVNAITDEQANKIAKYAETVISNYKTRYNYDFVYNAVTNPRYNTSYKGHYAYELLKKNNIDTNYLKTAMPIYIISTDSKTTDILGAYNRDLKYLEKITGDIFGISIDVFGAKPNNTTEEYEIEIAYSTYAFPYFVIDSDTLKNSYDDAKLVVAHELFHHYQRYVCGGGEYKECPSGLFTMETAANLAAVKTNKINNINTFINNHANAYFNSIEESIENVWNSSGYAAIVFAYNYSDVVKNGENVIINSITSSDPLKYIYDNSDGKYKTALLLTAEKNLTQDYDNKLLLSRINISGHKELSDNYFADRITMNHSSIHYYYLNPSNLSGDSKIKIEGRIVNPNITLLLFVKTNEGYNKVYTQDLDKQVVLKVSDWEDYEEIAFAFVETTIDNNDDYYNINISDVDINDDVTVTPESLGLKKPDQSKRRTHTIMCYQVEDDTMFKEVYQVLINLDKDEKINNMMLKGTLEIKNYDSNNPAYKIAKNTVSGLLTGIKLTYKSKLKHVQMYTAEKENKYSILFNVTKDYDKAFKGSFYVDPNGKESIINAVESQGFVCE